MDDREALKLRIRWTARRVASAAPYSPDWAAAIADFDAALELRVALMREARRAVRKRSTSSAA